MVDFDHESGKLPALVLTDPYRSISQPFQTTYKSVKDFEAPILNLIEPSASPVAQILSAGSELIKALGDLADLPASLSHKEEMRRQEVLNQTMARVKDATEIAVQAEKLSEGPTKQYLLNTALALIDPKIASKIDEKA